MGDSHYWLGYRHGRRIYHYDHLTDQEDRLRLEVQLAGTTNRTHRAFALGELRGYRHAADLPHPIVEGHRVIA